MNVNRYEGLSRSLSISLPLLDVTLIVLMLLLLAPPSEGPHGTQWTVTDQPGERAKRVLKLGAEGTFYHRGTRLDPDDLPGDFVTSSKKTVKLLVEPEAAFSTIKKALRQLNRAGFQPEVRILVEEASRE